MPPRARIISRPIARVAIPQLATWRTLRTNTNQLFCRLRSEEHTSELQSQSNLVCRLLLEKKKTETITIIIFIKLIRFVLCTVQDQRRFIRAVINVQQTFRHMFGWLIGISVRLATQSLMC